MSGLVKQKEYDWKDSNIANIVSNEDKNVGLCLLLFEEQRHFLLLFFFFFSFCRTFSWTSSRMSFLITGEKNWCTF